MDSSGHRKRLVYRTEHAAEVLGVQSASLRALAKRRRSAGAPVAWERHHALNPTDSYLFPVEFINDRARQEALDRGQPAPGPASVPYLELDLPDLDGETFPDAPSNRPLVDPETELELVKGEARVERDRREELEEDRRRGAHDELTARVSELEQAKARLEDELSLALTKVEQLAELLRADAVGRRSST